MAIGSYTTFLMTLICFRAKFDASAKLGSSGTSTKEQHEPYILAFILLFFWSFKLSARRQLVPVIEYKELNV